MGTTVLAQPYQSLIIAPQEIIVFLGILQRVHDITALRRWCIDPGAVQAAIMVPRKATAVVGRRLKHE